MTSDLFQCIDAGTENCPCHLAESGNCLTCSRLAGKECVDCQWRGVCIYNEYIQNGKVIKNTRREQKAPIVFKKLYDEETALFALDVGKGMAVKCVMPGTYLFLRRQSSEGYFNVPISVMRSDVENGQIWILVKGISAKTKTLLLEEDCFWVRGPYKNGIFGLDSLNEILKGRNTKNIPRMLIIAKGAGIAPGMKMVQFAGERCEITFYLDPAKLPEAAIEDCLAESSVDVLPMDLSNQEELDGLELDVVKGNYDGICIFASDYYVGTLGKSIRQLSDSARLLVSNNFNLCCGEGICGSCSVAGPKGETIKMCKCKFSGEEILEGQTVFV